MTGKDSRTSVVVDATCSQSAGSDATTACIDIESAAGFAACGECSKPQPEAKLSILDKAIPVGEKRGGAVSVKVSLAVTISIENRACGSQ